MRISDWSSDVCSSDLFNERIRIAGTLIDDDALAALLEEALDHADGLEASFFEVTTAVAFLAFARPPADACIVEVGLGGRLDATTVIAHPPGTGDRKRGGWGKGGSIRVDIGGGRRL